MHGINDRRKTALGSFDPASGRIGGKHVPLRRKFEKSDLWQMGGHPRAGRLRSRDPGASALERFREPPTHKPMTTRTPCAGYRIYYGGA